jgi:PAS domain S-box-containing protein
LVRYGGALASITLAIWLRRLLAPVLGPQFPFATIFLAVLVSAWIGGLRPALVALVLGAFGSSLFLMGPRSSHALGGLDRQVGLALYVCTGLGIALLGGSMHAAHGRALLTSDSIRRQAALIDQTYDAILVWAWDGPITFWNRGAERLYGFSRDAAIGQVSHNLLRTKCPGCPGGVEAFLQALDRQGSWEGELHHTTKSGDAAIVESRMVLVHDTAGNYVLEANRNITERKKVEVELREAHELLETRIRERTAELARTSEKLRATEERFRLLVEAVSGHAILMLDPNGTILTWNSGAETINGYTADEIIGQNYACLFTPEGIAEGKPERELELASTEGRADIEGWRVRKNGSRFWADGTLAAVYAADGRIHGFAKITRDMTAKRRNDELLRSVLDHTLDGIVSIDEVGTVSMINKAGQSLFGWTADEVIGQNVKMLMPAPYHADHDRYVANYLRTGQAKVIGIGREVRGVRKNGTSFPVDLAVTEFRLDEQRYFVGIVRDISERKKLETQLQQAQKMEAFGQLAGGVAHDFNNLLTVISLNTETLLTIIPSGGEVDGIVREIRDTGERAASLTHQLLAFSRQQVLEPRILDLGSVIADAEKMLRRVIGEDVQLATALPPGTSRVKVDPGQIHQVIMNLAVNARDAMPLGGKLTIETSNVVLGASYVQTHAEVRAGRFVMVAVSDTGCGMTPDVKRRIFEPFFTTKEVGRGTGLGLAVVHGIVKQSGGSIEVYSEPGCGTTFKIYLPAVDEEPSGVSPTRSGASPRGCETILLVEDENGVRKIAARTLEKCGYTVLTAADGQAALHLVASHEERIHLLLTDVVMPDVSGRQLAEALVARHPGLKLVFMSGYTADAVVRHGVLQANVAFLQKPFTPDALARKVRDTLDKGLSLAATTDRG